MNKQLPLLVFRAVALGLGIGALTLSLMEKISTNDAIVLLSLAVTCLAACAMGDYRGPHKQCEEGSQYSNKKEDKKK